MSKVLELYSDSGVFSDAGSTPAVNNDPVQQWNDTSGASHNRSQATSGNRPLLKTNVLNSLPVLRFDGSDDYLDGTWSNLAQPFTVAIVLKLASTGVTVPYGGSSGAFLYDWSASAGKINAGSDVSFAVVPTNWNVITAVFNGASSVVRVNGVETTGSAGGNGTGTNFAVGRWSGGGFNCPCDVAALVAYDTALDATARAAIETTLNSKYAVFGGGGDTTPPVLTNPVGTATGTTTATIGATTDEGNGTKYGVVTTSSTQPSVAQIKAGQDHTGSAAAFAGSGSVSATGAWTLSATGLAAATAYYAHLLQTDAALNDSNRVTSAQFTTNSPPVTVGVTDANFFFSPYNWYSDGGGALAANNVKGSSTYAQTTNTGAYLKTKFTGTSCKLNVTIPATSTPSIMYSVDGGVWTRSDMTSATTQVTLATGLSAGTHTLEVRVVFMLHSIDRWTTPVSRLRVTGLELDAAAATAAPTLYSGRAVVYADSNGEGFEIIGTGTSQANSDAGQAFPALLGRALSCEYGTIAFASQGYITATGSPANVPKLYDSGTPANSAWLAYHSGASRLVSSLFSPSPGYVLVMHGENDGGDVTSAVTALAGLWRTAAPSAKIAFCSPPQFSHDSQISAGVSAAADSNVKYVTTGENMLSAAWSEYSAGLHLSNRGHARYAAVLAKEIDSAFATGGSGPVPMIGSPLIRSLQ